ncbi:IL21 protein, partial [Picathartes gymnocephalus]|nr:IL21 protein [Picathartes gymnocephalus]
MKRMIIFCMIFFCFSMVLTAASRRQLIYKQINKKIEDLETMVKDKDAELLHTPENLEEGCLYTVVTCFKKGIQKLQPASSQENPQFSQAKRIVSKFAMILFIFQQCKSTCESYKKKTPKEFLKGFANLMQ